MKLTVRHRALPGQPVIGRLLEDARGRVFFEYDADWPARGLELSPLYLPLDTGGSVTTPTPEVGPLFGLFADSLPDWWGEQLMKRHFANLGIPWGEVTELEKLACQGSHAMGALGYEPDLSGSHFRDVLVTDVSRLVESARDFVHGETKEVLPALVRGGITPGGAQPKVLLAFNDDFSKCVAGGGKTPEGYSPWLLKFQFDPELPVGREEQAFTRMAAAAGIEVPETRLLPTRDGSVHFMARRFDRIDGGIPVHMHSYSGLTHTTVRSGLDYGDLMNLTRHLTNDAREVEQVFLRAVFNVAAGNHDDHGRNHSLVMSAEGRWRVSPAYDLTLCSNPLASGIRAASINGRFAGIDRAELRKLGESQGIRAVDDRIDEVLAALRRWPEFAADAGLGAVQTDLLANQFPAASW